MIDKALLRRVAQRTMEWPFRLRGFGEGIALRGLLATYAATGESEYLGYVHGLTRAYLGSGVARSPEDHVAPSREFLEIYQHTGDRESWKPVSGWLHCTDPFPSINIRRAVIVTISLDGRNKYG